MVAGGVRVAMKETQTHRCEQRAFTRLELMAVLFALAFLATIALPMLASSRGRAEQASCFNHLRQIGRAFQLWASDHGDRNPWATPVREGGTFGSTNPYKAEAYFQMGMISNELATPRVLVCPSDIGVGGAPRRMASDFSFTNLNGGFFVVGFRSAALSFTIGL